MDVTITSARSRLQGHLALPATAPASAVALCHGFPTGPRGAIAAGSTFPELADRIAREVGCVALAFNFRGTGGSEGDFSIGAWLEDIHAVVSDLDSRADVTGVWLIGVAEGGALALTAAAEQPRVRGVATLAAPRAFGDWARESGRLLDYARRAGMVHTPGFPESISAWAREVSAIDAEAAARKLAPRPLLVLHGSEDDVVAVDDARALVTAAGDSAELRIVQAAGHELRHDPRAIAALLGWLDRVA